MFYDNVVQFIENVLNTVHCTVYKEWIYICDAWNNYVLQFCVSTLWGRFVQLMIKIQCMMYIYIYIYSLHIVYMLLVCIVYTMYIV